MGRFPQPEGARGSQKWIQLVINKHQELINQQLPCRSPIKWVSPLSEDKYAEYRDQAFLDLLNIQLGERPLTTFWPQRGPQWDALGRSENGDILLVEAKSHVTELLSPGTGASENSKALIEKSLKEVQSFLRAKSMVDWSQVFYQYTNRLAHLYLLRNLNKVPAFLVFVYFVGDREMSGPNTKQEWQSALQIVKGVLGLHEGHGLSKYMLDIFIDVSEINQ